MQQHVLDFYAQPALMTSAGHYARLFDGLPPDVAGLTRVAQGLLLHEHIAPTYGVTLSGERRSSVHIRQVEGLLDRLLAEDDRPLTTARPLRLPAARLSYPNGAERQVADHRAASQIECAI
jgi:hypothetical protein